MTSASVKTAARKLEEAGLTVVVEGDSILCEDRGLFDRSHDGVKGTSRWLKDTLGEYEEACAELFAQDEEHTQEEPMNIVEKRIQEELLTFAPAPPVKNHAGLEAQMEMAKEFNSPKEIAQALENDDQDRGGIPSPETYITERKQEVAEAIVVLMKGQRFLAPEGWKIKETRKDKALYYGSLYIKRKMDNERKGSRFSLVRDQ